MALDSIYTAYKRAIMAEIIENRYTVLQFLSYEKSVISSPTLLPVQDVPRGGSEGAVPILPEAGPP